MTTDPAAVPSPSPPPAASAPPWHIRFTGEASAPPWHIRFSGEGGALFGIALLNLILNVVTLGIWFGWGRVRELRYLVGAVRVEGDPLSFHGRGGELLRGVLIAFFAFLVPIYALFILAGRDADRPNLGFMMLGYLLLILLVGFASVGSLRYRLPRTEWRGIRFGFDGRSREFVPGFVGRIVLMVVTWGLTYPLYAVWRREWMMRHSRFGSARFSFEGSPRELYGTFLVCWFLGIPTLGLAWVYYTGFQQAWFWNRTRLADAKFATSMTGKGWLGFQLVNALLAIFTLGIAAPWVVARTHRYFLEHLSLEGTLDLGSIRQERQRTSGVGEGALDVLDMDSGLDLG